MSPMGFFFLVLLCSVVSAQANSQSGEFFVRSAKWAHLTPSGGALVSGRGNFRPGFYGQDWRSAMAEPSFNKRSFAPSRLWAVQRGDLLF